MMIRRYEFDRLLLKLKHFSFFLMLLLTYTQPLNCMMRDMAVMMGAQLGASIADTTVSNMYQQVAQGIQKDQTNMSIASNSFLQNIQLAQQAQLKNMVSIFSSAQQQVDTMMTQQTDMTKQMQNYIESIVSLQTPTTEYLSDPVECDQIFANGTMYAPQGPTWKNLFQVGNWQYDETTNSFWQMQQEPFLTQASTSAAINNAYQNSIFTEWQTHQPYEIIADIKLYQVTYPFYVGIICNKARWISGDTYGIQKYRTLGLYGNKDKQISLCYAQQTMPPTSATVTTIPTPNYPLAQIQAGLGAQKQIINQALFQNLQLQPVTIHLKIKPGPTTIEYKVWFNDGTPEPQSYIMLKTATTSKTSKKSNANNVTITANGSTYTYQVVNDSDIYLYHGVGFLSPGAIAQFTLKGPNALVFSPQSVQTFTSDFASYVKQQQAKIATKKIDSTMLKDN